MITEHSGFLTLKSGKIVHWEADVLDKPDGARGIMGGRICRLDIYGPGKEVLAHYLCSANGNLQDREFVAPDYDVSDLFWALIERLDDGRRP